MEYIDDNIDAKLEAAFNRLKVSGARRDNVFTMHTEDEVIEVEEMKLSHTTFLNASIILYGASKSGKTNTTKYLINLLNRHIPVVICFCPTNAMNKTYSGILPDACIHDEVNYECVANIYAYQRSKRLFYQEINNLDNLTNIVNKFGIKNAFADMQQSIDKANAIKQQLLSANLPGVDDVEKAINTYQINKLKLTLQNYINSIKPELRRERLALLTEIEQKIVNNLYFNPNLLLIFDDCTSELAALIKEGDKEKDPQRRGIIKNLFTKGRHYNITVIVCIHSPAALATEIRNNARFSVMGTKNVALNFVANTLRNGKTDMSVIRGMHDPTINPNRFTKAVYDNNETRWYHMTAPKMDNVKVVACSPILRSYCETLHKHANKDNSAYFGKFY